MAVLKVLKGRNPGQQFPLNADRTVIGRHPECDIVLDMASVSREHAQVLREGDDYYVEDLHSRNGTFVNGELVQQRRLLKENDRLKICDLLFTFHRQLVDQPASTTTGHAPSQETTRPAMVLEDRESDGATIMGHLDVPVSDPSGLRLTVRPESKLRALIEITENLGKVLDLDKVLAGVLDSLFKIFIQADRGFIVLRDQASGALVPRAIKYRHGPSDETARISRTIVRKAMETRQAILSADAASDERFDLSQSIADFKIRSMMCAPLINSDGEPLGVIQVDTQNQRARFRQDDLDVLIAVARQAAIALENAQLHQWALRQQALERDIELAHKVQRGFLPSTPPKLPGYRFFDYYEPARRLGGDYYDYVELPDGRLAVVVADVSGKGISAALLTAKLSAEIRYCLASEAEPALAMRRLNRTFAHAGWEDRFVTLVLAVLDPATHTLSIVNAGHMAPLLRRADGTVEPLGNQVTGFPLGVVDEFPYEQETLSLAPDENVVLYTDGISEAMSPGGELFTIDRLKDEVQRAPACPAQMGRAILERVRGFVAGQPPSDDICLLCFGRTHNVPPADDASQWTWTKQHQFPSQTGAGKRILEEILDQLDQHGWPQRDVFGIHLAVEEALVNAIKHGNQLDPQKNVQVDCRLSAERFWIAIEDEGPGFNPHEVPDPTQPENLDIPGGRGLMLMRNFMNCVEFNDRGNRVVMEKTRSPDDEQDAPPA